MKKTKEMMEGTHKRNSEADWNEYKELHCSKFEKLLSQLYEKNPQEMEEAKLWFKMALSEVK